ncbi:hypothetical protein BuS5_00102 [Desulfosarcina sp. BuS5]|nr:hypothetical protein BuS5_00102 [Desulfosarcina sp. BuS5]
MQKPNRTLLNFFIPYNMQKPNRTLLILLLILGMEVNVQAVDAKLNKYANHLAGEKSPYLLQHASNPVNWYPWGEEAFQRARQEEKPIFLSIGYATCHWCHVMWHMNRLRMKT